MKKVFLVLFISLFVLVGCNKEPKNTLEYHGKIISCDITRGASQGFFSSSTDLYVTIKTDEGYVCTLTSCPPVEIGTFLMERRYEDGRSFVYWVKYTEDGKDIRFCTTTSTYEFTMYRVKDR